MVNFVYLKKPFIAFASPFSYQVAKICKIIIIIIIYVWELYITEKNILI
jgi:hypothetical protein